MQIDLLKKKEEPKEDVSLAYTKKILFALKSKMREFNIDSPKRVSLSKLKELFILGAKDGCDCKKIVCSFARVNMFLRLFEQDAFLREIYSHKNEKFYPSKEDFEGAEADIKKFNIDFDFTNIEELYLSKAEEVSYLEMFI